MVRHSFDTHISSLLKLSTYKANDSSPSPIGPERARPGVPGYRKFQMVSLSYVLIVASLLSLSLKKKGRPTLIPHSHPSR